MDMQNVTKLNIPEGEVRTIHDKDGRLIWGKVSYNVKYKGDTAQNGAPTPSAPIPVQTVTGENTLTISDGTNTQSYPISLGSIELCKIDTYQDYIYKDGDKWYVHKEVGKTELSSSWNWYYNSSSQGFSVQFSVDRLFSAYVGFCTHAEVQTSSATWTGVGKCGWNTSNTFWFEDGGAVATSAAGFKTWLDSNIVNVHYALATPTDTEITNQALVAQLEAIEQWLARYGYNATVSGNLPIVIDRTAL